MDDRLIFLAGAIAGAIVAVIFVWLLNRISAARNKAGQRHKPAIAGQTATQVHRKSITASFAWLFWLLALVGFVAFLGYLAYLLFTR